MVLLLSRLNWVTLHYLYHLLTLLVVDLLCQLLQCKQFQSVFAQGFSLLASVDWFRYSFIILITWGYSRQSLCERMCEWARLFHVQLLHHTVLTCWDKWSNSPSTTDICWNFHNMLCSCAITLWRIMCTTHLPLWVEHAICVDMCDLWGIARCCFLCPVSLLSHFDHLELEDISNGIVLFAIGYMLKKSDDLLLGHGLWFQQLQLLGDAFGWNICWQTFFDASKWYMPTLSTSGHIYQWSQ